VAQFFNMELAYATTRSFQMFFHHDRESKAVLCLRGAVR
jgi:hypothetical protein